MFKPCNFYLQFPLESHNIHKRKKALFSTIKEKDFSSHFILKTFMCVGKTII